VTGAFFFANAQTAEKDPLTTLLPSCVVIAIS
jgi:hypothetical protein